MHSARPPVAVAAASAALMNPASLSRRLLGFSTDALRLYAAAAAPPRPIGAGLEALCFRVVRPSVRATPGRRRSSDCLSSTAIVSFVFLCVGLDHFHFVFSDFVLLGLVFTARCYASAVLAMALCLSVRLSVRHKSVFY